MTAPNIATPPTPTPPAPPAATPPSPPAAVVTPPSGDPPTPPAAPPAPPTEPAKYDLKLPDKATLDASATERIAAFARERGLSPEQAQATVDLADSMVGQHLQSQDAKFQASVEEWGKQTLADARLGKTPDERKAAIARGTAVIEKFAQKYPEDGAKVKEILNVTGWGNHPSLALLVSWFGDQGREAPPVVADATAGSQTSEREALQKMFPNSPELFKKEGAAT